MKKRLYNLLSSVKESIRNFFLNSTSLLVKKLSRVELILSSKENPNPNGYEDLTPTDKGNEDKKYSKVIEWALKNSNIKNIALTGPYGSGKSSITITIIKLCRRRYRINIKKLNPIPII